MNRALEKRFEDIEKLAIKMGLDFFPVVFEEVPREIIWDVASYGLPTRMSHWSFGRTFLHQKTYGEMGFSKIYELILNNDPSYAFLDDTNSDVVNLLICAHCIGHSSFFKKNACFAKTNRNMVNQAERNAKIVDQYKEKYGIDVVEDWMDVGFAIDRHIDPTLGETRKKYPELTHEFKEIQPLPYADLHGDDERPTVVAQLKNDKFPPHPERDILWFLTNYAKMLPWQREVLSIIRSESFYFYPQQQTKIMNEGWASFWHAELMLNYDDLSAPEHADFAKAHSGVIRPGRVSINPYYVGFRIFTDIKKRWDEAYKEGKKDKAFQKSDLIDMFDDKTGKLIASKVDGNQKMFEVMCEDNDYSFIHNYLTRELADNMKLFTYGPAGNVPDDADPEDDDLVILDRELHHIQQAMTSRTHNYGAPSIVIDKVEENTLGLLHEKKDKMPLDEKYARETLKYIQKVWNGPICLRTRDRFGSPFKMRVGFEGVGTKETTKDSKTFKFDI